MTSFQAVRLVRRWSGERRSGHGGTLDPMATGVLPILLGQATRVAEFLSEHRKVYHAEITLGAATETYDAAGRITTTCDPSAVTREDLEPVLPRFRGLIEQTPPPYSAVKIAGERAYRLARAGLPVQAPPRPVHVYALELREWLPPRFTLGIECGSGTYVRSLAHDIGQALGCGAHLSALVRVRVGPFRLQDALELETLKELLGQAGAPALLTPFDSILLQWHAAVVNEAHARDLSTGKQLAFRANSAARCRAYDTQGSLVALLRPDGGERWHPFKVFSTAASEEQQPGTA